MGRIGGQAGGAASVRGRRPDPREWVGDAGFPWPSPEELGQDQRVAACYAVTGVSPASDPAGEPILILELAEARGRIRAWLPAAAGEEIGAGLYIGVRGQIDARGEPLLRIDELSPIRVALDDLELFLPRTGRDLEALDRDLRDLIESVGDPQLRELLDRVLGPDTEIGRGFRLAPAATRNHHACLGGLLEHTVSVARLCAAAADHYGSVVDRDLLVTAALLHDVGKVREIAAQVGFPYTDEGRLLGHILLGLRMVGREAREAGIAPDRLALLEHLIASHQGRYEWQSPREPRILEGLLLHYLDDLDAKVGHVTDLLPSAQNGWSDFDRSTGREWLRHRAPTEPAPASHTPARHRTGKPARKRKSGRAGSTKKQARSGRAARGRSAERKAGPRGTAPGSEGRSQVADHGGTGFIDRDTLDLFA